MSTFFQVLNSWFGSFDEKTNSALFGKNLDNVYSVVKKFDLYISNLKKTKNLADIAFIYLEMPLLGESYTDICFTLKYKDFLQINSNKTALDINLELISKVAELYPPKSVFFAEFDTGSDPKNFSPSIFFQNKKLEEVDKLLTCISKDVCRLPQWQRLLEIWEKVKPVQWVLPHIGIMEGRKNSPLRVIFANLNNIENPLQTGQLKDLFKRIGFSCEFLDIQSKIEVLTKFGDHLNNYNFIDLDLMPNGEWGNMVGLEFLQRLPLNAKHIPFVYIEKLNQQVLQWHLADERINLLKDCGKLLFVKDKQSGNDILISSQVSHIKLRWQNGKPIFAKAYIEIMLL